MAKKSLKAKVTALDLHTAERKTGLEIIQVGSRKYEVHKQGKCVFEGTYTTTSNYVLNAAFMIEF